MATSDWLLSIDFGTSNTAAAHSGATSGAVETLSLTHSSNLMRSAVYVAGPTSIAVGDVAVNEAERNPSGYIPAPKRLIGQPFVVVNGARIPLHVPIAAVFGAVMKKAVAAHGGRPPARVVLTHPEAWSPAQIQVLTEAAKAVGIRPDQVSTISEPRAAAQHYTRSHALAPGNRIAVFDFGGGTLDIAVLTAEDTGSGGVGFSVIAARGDNGLGGKNFDALIRGWVDQQLEVRNPSALEFLRGAAPMSVKQSLDESIRRAKELLSEAPSATITFTGGGFHETLQITRDEFDELISPVTERAIALTRATLADTGITDPGQLDALYLTGGSSRVPLIHQRLREVGPVATLDDPKTVVAQGALVALQAPTTAPAASLPGAADLMPSWQQGGAQRPTTGNPANAGDWQRGANTPATPGSTSSPGSPHTGTPADTSPPAATGKSGKKFAIVGAGLVALIAVIAIAAYFGLRKDSPDSVAAAGSTPSSESSESSSAAGATTGTTVDEIRAALPRALRDSVQGCQLSGDTINTGSPIMHCTLSPSSEAGAPLTTEIKIAAYLDSAAAAANIDSILNNADGELHDVLVTNTDRTAAAEIDGGDTADITYVNTTAGTGVVTSGLIGEDKARQFLNSSGLIRD